MRSRLAGKTAIKMIGGSAFHIWSQVRSKARILDQRNGNTQVVRLPAAGTTKATKFFGKRSQDTSFAQTPDISYAAIAAYNRMGAGTATSEETTRPSTYFGYTTPTGGIYYRETNSSYVCNPMAGQHTRDIKVCAESGAG
jgi:hypothetical protein